MNDYVYSFIHQSRAIRDIYIKRNNIMILTNNEWNNSRECQGYVYV